MSAPKLTAAQLHTLRFFSSARPFEYPRKSTIGDVALTLISLGALRTENRHDGWVRVYITAAGRAALTEGSR